MKSKFNPIFYMLSAYKRFVNSEIEYEKSFLIHTEEIEYTKLLAFCKSLLVLMKMNGIAYSIKENQIENAIDLFYENTLIITYEIALFKTVKNENSLKFQLLIEWGILLELNNKKQLLIAL